MDQGGLVISRLPPENDGTLLRNNFRDNQNVLSEELEPVARTSGSRTGLVSLHGCAGSKSGGNGTMQGRTSGEEKAAVSRETTDLSFGSGHATNSPRHSGQFLSCC